MKGFRDKILYNHKERGAFLCIGLDPRITPDETASTQARRSQTICEEIVATNKRIIEETKDVCACYKPNIAFYECWGAAGLEALIKTLALIPSEIPVILDAKRSDIGSTAQAYARAAFEHCKVDAVTLSPYMGKESIEPFLSYEHAFVFMLVRTSNPSSHKFQMLEAQGKPLYQHVANESAQWAPDQRLGFVVGAAELEALAYMKEAQPTRLLLCPGIGAQGGDIEPCVQHALSKSKDTVLPVVSRSIANAQDPRAVASQYNEKTRKAFALQATESMGAQHKASPRFATTTVSVQEAHSLIDDLFRTACFKLGDFTLKSGARSPFYIDLRRIVSFPHLMKRVVKTYNTLAASLTYNCIAGIPTAGLPFAAALAYTQNLPMIYPRIPKKPHGTGNSIEGEYQKGTKVLLLDDLITQGTSKHEAISILREAEIAVQDLVVLIRRSPHAEEDMRQCGITLHYALDIADIAHRGKQTGAISAAQYKAVCAFIST